MLAKKEQSEREGNQYSFVLFSKQGEGLVKIAKRFNQPGGVT